MSEITQRQFIGTILPLGNGAVGKTSVGVILSSIDPSENITVQKTKNLEFEYTVDRINLDGLVYRVSHQYLIPPGQKEEEGDLNSRSYEKVIGIFEEIIGCPAVILLVYDITSLVSFQDLEYWMKQAIKLSDQKTEYIMVGTHLDSDDYREVYQDLVINGIEYIEQTIKSFIPGWDGHIKSIEISNKTRTNIETLRNMISCCIMAVNGYDCDDEYKYPADFSRKTCMNMVSDLS